MTITKEIKFYPIRNLGRYDINLYIDQSPRIKKFSILFDQYRNNGFSSESEKHHNSGKRNSLSTLQTIKVKVFGVFYRSFMEVKQVYKLKEIPHYFSVILKALPSEELEPY